MTHPGHRRTGAGIDTERLARGLDKMSRQVRALGGHAPRIGRSFRGMASDVEETRSDLNAAVAKLEGAVLRPTNAATRRITSSFEGTATAARGAAAAPSQVFPPTSSVTLQIQPGVTGTVAAELMRLMPQIEERVGNAIRDGVRRRGGPEAAFG